MDTLVSLSKLLYFIRNIIRAEFASKGVAGSGLGLGIAGTALGLLNNGGNGNGLLGGLLGGGNQNVVSALQAENSMLKAENYSDKNAKEVYAQSLADNRRLRDETFAYLKPLADESANNRVELAKLQALRQGEMSWANRLHLWAKIVRLLRCPEAGRRKNFFLHQLQEAHASRKEKHLFNRT